MKRLRCRLTRAQAVKQLLKDREWELSHLMGKESYTKYANVNDCISALEGGKFKKGKVKYDKYGNKTVYMKRVARVKKWLK